MIDFARLHQKYWPTSTPKEASNHLNDFEVKLFNKMPWLLEQPEHYQNDVIEYCLELAYRRALQ